jgi:deoxyribose-phosphate aldolase
MTTPSHSELTDLIEQTVAKITLEPSFSSDEASNAAVLTPAQMAAFIDHTLLKPDATQSQIHQLCDEARTHAFASVCVNATWAPVCAGLLAGATSKVCTVVGFPLGATLTDVKAFEAERAVALGAHEVDMVINVGRLKSGQYAEVYADIAAVVQAAHAHGALLKVIIETALLSLHDKVAACVLSQRAGADFVKTSTGFSGGGATVEDVRLMRRLMGPHLGVKASGGVRTAADARQMIAAGATRIGASAGVQIVRELSEPQADAAAPRKRAKDSY